MAGHRPQGAIIACQQCRPKQGHPGNIVLEAGIVGSDDTRQDWSHLHLHVFQIHRVRQRAYHQGVCNVHVGQLWRPCRQVCQFQLWLACGLPWRLGLCHQALLRRLDVFDWPIIMDPIQTGVWFGRARRAWHPHLQRRGHGRLEALWHSL